MQIPELNLFWLLVGAFVAAGVTWAIDFVMVKRQGSNDVDPVQFSALNEKARMVEPLNQQLQFARSQISELETKLRELPERGAEFDLTPYTTRIDELTAELDAARTENSEIATVLSAAQAGAGQTDELNATLLQLRQDLAAKDSELGELVSSVSQLKHENDVLRQSASGLTPEIETLKNNFAQAELDAAQAKQALAELRDRFETMQAAELSSGPELAELRQRAAAAESQAETLRAQLLVVQNIPDLREEFSELKEKLNQVESQREQSVAALAEFRAGDEDRTKRLDDLQRELNEAQAALQQARNEERSLADELAELRQSASETTLVRAQIAAMSSNLESLESTNAEQTRELEDLRAQLAQTDEMRSEYEKFSSKLPELERASVDRDDLQQQVSRLERQLLDQDEIIENFRNQVQRANAEVAQSQSAANAIREMETLLDERNAEITRLSRRAPELETLVSELREELEEKASRIEKLEASDSEANELRAMVQTLSAELENSRRESQEIRNALVKVQAEAEILRESTGELETVKSENIRLKNYVESNEVSQSEIAPLRNRLNELFGHLDESNRENEGNRRALQATMDELRKLRQDMGDLSRLREENARLRVVKQIGNEPEEFSTLKMRISDVASQLTQTKEEAFDAREQLAKANREISRLRAELMASSELGELS